VHTAERFDRLCLVNLIIEFAAFLRNGEHPDAGHALERTGWRGVQHADAQIGVISHIYQNQSSDKAAYDLFKNSRAGHRGSIGQSACFKGRVATA
jgi:hypothetical protein